MNNDTESTPPHTNKYYTPIELRGPQREMVLAAQAKVSEGKNFMLALLVPGVGKSLGALAISDYLFSETDIQVVIFVTIRRNLRNQIKRDHKFYSQIYNSKKVQYVDERESFPLIGRNERHIVVSVTYNYLVNNQEMIIRDYSGSQIAYIFDECDRLGMPEEISDDDEATDTIKASAVVEAIAAQQPGFVVMMTGYAYRHDEKRLILCDDYYYMKGDKEYLASDVECDLTRAISEGYLRPLEFRGRDGDYTEIDNLTDEEAKGRISERRRGLTRLLKRQETWKPFVDDTIKEMLEHRSKFKFRFRAIIACTDINHANQIDIYIQQNYKDIKTMVSTSRDDPKDQNLRDFRDKKHGDILITVLKATVGFDSKDISVVGLLTAIRSESLIRQTIARGQRTLDNVDEEQYCSVIHLKDQKMMDIVDRLRKDSDRGRELRQQIIQEEEDRERWLNNFLGSGVALAGAPRYDIINVDIDEDQAISGTGIHEEATGSKAKWADTVGRKVKTSAAKVLFIIEQYEKFEGRQDQSETEVEMEILCKKYKCEPGDLRDKIYAEIRKWIRKDIIPDSLINTPHERIYYQAAMSVLKHWNNDIKVKETMSPLEMNSLFERAKIGYDIFYEDVEQMYNYIKDKKG